MPELHSEYEEPFSRQLYSDRSPCCSLEHRGEAEAIHLIDNSEHFTTSLSKRLYKMGAIPQHPCWFFCSFPVVQQLFSNVSESYFSFQNLLNPSNKSNRDCTSPESLFRRESEEWEELKIRMLKFCAPSFRYEILKSLHRLQWPESDIVDPRTIRRCHSWACLLCSSSHAHCPTVCNWEYMLDKYWVKYLIQLAQ